MSILRRELNVAVKVLDPSAGIVEYVASDESIDSYREIVRAAGWRFTRFQKNAPFVDSHQYGSIDCLLGNVIQFEVKDSRLVETVKWAIDVPSNSRARIGWDMTRAGYLKAVSVGFIPVKMATRWDSDTAPFAAQLAELKLGPESNVRTIYLEQEQIELSAVIIGANPNALLNVAKAYKGAVLSDADLQLLSEGLARRELPSPAASDRGHAADETPAHAQAQWLLGQIERITKNL